MEINEQDEYEFIVELSRNAPLPNDIDDDVNDNIEETEESQNKENVRGRGRGKGRGRPRGRGRGHDSTRNEQILQLPPPPSFDILQHSKPLHEFTVTFPHEHQFNIPTLYSIFSLFFSLE